MHKNITTVKNAAATACPRRNSQRDCDDVNPHLIAEYMPLVDSIYSRLIRKIPQHVETEDLRSAGIVGLVAALKKFNTSQAETFMGYATMRIKGAILDEMRKRDNMPRRARRKARELNAAVEKLEQALGRAPNDDEIMAELGLSKSEYRELVNRVQPVSLISLDTTPSQSDQKDGGPLHERVPDVIQEMSYERLERKEMAGIVRKALDQLPDRYRQIIAMHYHEGMRLTDIARIFELSDARICQIHTKSLSIIRKYVEAHAAR